MVVLAGPAAAHTAFESSDPADGDVVAAGTDTIRIDFTNEAEPVGEGFVVLDPELGVREPTAVEQPSTGAFVLSFDPPISAGQVGVRWTVRAPDAHPIEGAFRFTVDARGAATTAPAGDPSVDGSARGAAPAGLDDFLQADDGSAVAQRVSDLGRILSMGGMMVSIGFLAFATLVLRGSRHELRAVLFWIRRASVAVVVGTVLDCAGYVVDVSGAGIGAALDPGAYGDALSTSAVVAYLLRIASGVVVAGTARVSMVRAHQATDVLASVQAAVPVGAGSTPVVDRTTDVGEHDVAWDLDRAGLLPAAGFVAMLVSHTFDGHTVTEGNRVLTGLASATHVLAAAVWAGGVAALALVVARRRRRGEPTRSLLLVTRFSILATVALVAVAVSGTALAWVIADTPSDLWSTPWGRVLLAKVAVVALAAGLGARNHHVIVPALEAAEGDDVAVGRLRRTLAVEVAALSGVTVLTAVLVRAASTI